MIRIKLVLFRHPAVDNIFMIFWEGIKLFSVFCVVSVTSGFNKHCSRFLSTFNSLVEHGMSCTFIADLPTPVTCKSGGFENKSRKTWRLGPQTWRFSKYVSNNKKSIICLRVFLFYLSFLPFLCSRLSFPRNPCAPMFHWNEADIYIVPSFLSQIG